MIHAHLKRCSIIWFDFYGDCRLACWEVAAGVHALTRQQDGCLFCADFLGVAQGGLAPDCAVASERHSMCDDSCAPGIAGVAVMHIERDKDECCFRDSAVLYATRAGRIGPLAGGERATL